MITIEYFNQRGRHDCLELDDLSAFHPPDDAIDRIERSQMIIE